MSRRASSARVEVDLCCGQVAAPEPKQRPVAQPVKTPDACDLGLGADRLVEHPLGLVPSAHVHQRLAPAAGDPVEAARYSELAGELGALPRHRFRLLEAAVGQEDLGEVERCPEQVVRVAKVLGDAVRLLEVRDPVLDVPETGERAAQGVERVTLLGTGTGQPGEGDRLLTAGASSRQAAVHHEHLPVRGERPGALGRRRRGGDRGHGLLRGGHRLVAVPVHVVVTGQPFQQDTGELRVDRGVGLRQRSPHHLHRPGGVPDQEHHLSGLPQQRRVIQWAAGRCLGLLRPQRERRAGSAARPPPARRRPRQACPARTDATSASPMFWAAYQW